jgi:hypothetical protein
MVLKNLIWFMPETGDPRHPSSFKIAVFQARLDREIQSRPIRAGLAARCDLRSIFVSNDALVSAWTFVNHLIKLTVRNSVYIFAAIENHFLAFMARKVAFNHCKVAQQAHVYSDG